MKKKSLSLILAVVAFVCLLGVYFILQNRESANTPEPEPTETPSEYFYLTDRTKDELVSFTLEGQNETLNFSQREDESNAKVWYIEEYSDALLSTYTVNNLATSAYTLSTDTKLMDEPASLTEYGLDPPRATLTSKFSDGTESAVHVGNLAPTGDYYYAMTENDPALYLLYKYTGDRLFYQLKDVLDLTLPAINTEALTYTYIHEEGKPEIEIDFSGTEEEKQKDIESFGAVVLTMFKPYAGREIYASNLVEFILKGIDSISASELVEYSTEDFSQYGLDNPKLDIWLKDTANELHILVGDDTGNGTNYCKLADQDMVFTVKSDTFKNFYNINVNGFIERFVALVNIVNVTSVEIRSEEANYDIHLTHTKDEEDYDIIIPEIDGQEVQELAFKTFYSSMIGLAYDTEIPIYTPDGDPDVTITYYLNNGQEPVVTQYYGYNSNFFAVKKADYDIQFVVSRQNMDLMFKNMVKLLAGELDREY